MRTELSRLHEEDGIPHRGIESNSCRKVPEVQGRVDMGKFQLVEALRGIPLGGISSVTRF